MQILTIISKRKADSIILDSLFKSNKTLTPRKYDLGKYAKSGIGNTVTTPFEPGYLNIIWSVRRKDKDGAYYQLMCA
jgi:hypothetical protein